MPVDPFVSLAVRPPKTPSKLTVTVVEAVLLHPFASVPNSTPDAYLMDHSTIMYLMDPQGRFLKHFTYTNDAAGLAKALNQAISG
jgi:cytochrome oxidase Cu insertion factor (SCO1/SenC/PrrC family)